MLETLEQIAQFYLNPENADRVASIFSVAAVAFLIIYVPAQIVLSRRLGGLGAFAVAAFGGSTAFLAVLYWYAPADFLREIRTSTAAYWSIQLNTPGHEEVTAVRSLSSGDIVVGVNSVSPTADRVQGTLRAYSPTGTLRWTTNIGRGANARVVSIGVNDLDQIIVAGEAIEFAPDESGFLQIGRVTPYLARLSSSGLLEWERTFAPTMQAETADPGVMHLSVSRSIMFAFGTRLDNEPKATQLICLSENGQPAWSQRIANDDSEFLGAFGTYCEDGGSVAEVVRIKKPAEPATSSAAKVEIVRVSGTRIAAKPQGIPTSSIATVGDGTASMSPIFVGRPPSILVAKKGARVSAFKLAARISSLDEKGNLARQTMHPLDIEPYADAEFGTPIEVDFGEYSLPAVLSGTREKATIVNFRLSVDAIPQKHQLQLPADVNPEHLNIAAVAWQKDDGVNGGRLVLAGSYRLLPRARAELPNKRIAMASAFPVLAIGGGCGGCGPDGKLANWLAVFSVPDGGAPSPLFSRVYDNPGDSRFADVDVSRNGDLIAVGTMGANEGCCGDAAWRSDGLVIREDKSWAARN